MNDGGLTAWRRQSNNARMLALQSAGPHSPAAPGPVEIASFGASAIRLTTPAGLAVMIDPWRNLPAGRTDWFWHDFPDTAVDIGLSTHAHFDHDALHRLDASVLIDRLTGRYGFADLTLTGIADKHAIDFTHGAYDLQAIYRYLGRPEMRPPDNARAWDNCLIIAETGGLRILHWGDNRPDPPGPVWAALGQIDILILPVDDSQHVLSHPNVAAIIARLAPAVVIPVHYFNPAITSPASTLLGTDRWLAAQPRVLHHDHAAAWHADHGLDVTTGKA